MTTHEVYMQRCLQLAELAAGYVAPNPMVGALLVHNDIIIGEGYHMEFGAAHAEVNCLNNVADHNKHLISESTLYVSLEPCNHFGKTPPCTELIIACKIPRVIIACTDPFEKVNGSGIERLKNAGVIVIGGILEKEAIALNKRFFIFHQRRRPYIILKWAQSGNFKIAGEQSRPVKISNEISNRLVHKWRSEEAAIMVGTNTALADNPFLTTRLWEGKNAVRVVIDNNLSLPSSLRLFDNAVPTIILNKIKDESLGNLLFHKYNPGEGLVLETLNTLYHQNITSLIVEGGATLLRTFIAAGMWDEARIITNKDMILNSGLEAPVLGDALLLKREMILRDEVAYYKRKDPADVK